MRYFKQINNSNKKLFGPRSKSPSKNKVLSRKKLPPAIREMYVNEGR